MEISDRYYFRLERRVRKIVGYSDGVENEGYNKTSTKLKLLQCAANLFATQGFTETSVRELGTAAGLKVSTLYYHFPSKNAIMEHLLNDYASQSFGLLHEQDMKTILRRTPTTDGVLACMRLRFPPGKEDYYLKILCVILQEQHRNPTMRNIAKDIILNAERKIRFCFNYLKEINVFRQDAIPGYYMRVTSSLLYTYSSRYFLGIGDDTPEHSSLPLADLLRTTIDLMFQNCAIAEDVNEP